MVLIKDQKKKKRNTRKT